MGGWRLGERFLMLFSRSPQESDYGPKSLEVTSDEALVDLRREFPNFDAEIRGKSILDFGCGIGLQSLALSEGGAGYVLGLDLQEEGLEIARARARERGVAPERLEFKTAIPESVQGSFDIVLSKDSFEHFDDPAAILQMMAASLNSDGRIFITFGPPWFAPYGSHMHFFTKFPWVNVIFSERTVLNVRNQFRNDGATRYEDVQGGLNRMTVKRFETLIAQSRLNPTWVRLSAVKNLSFLCRLPVVRELFVNQITSILSPPGPTPSG